MLLARTMAPPSYANLLTRVRRAGPLFLTRASLSKAFRRLRRAGPVESFRSAEGAGVAELG